MIEKKYKKDFEYQLKWFIQRDMREECFEIGMYKIFNHRFDFRKIKGTYVYEFGGNKENSN